MRTGRVHDESDCVCVCVGGGGGGGGGGYRPLVGLACWHKELQEIIKMVTLYPIFFACAESAKGVLSFERL